MLHPVRNLGKQCPLQAAAQHITVPADARVSVDTRADNCRALVSVPVIKKL